MLADLNQCGPTTWQHERTFVGLGQGAHVLRVTFQTATCDTEAPKINVDAFRAYSEARTYQYDDDNRLLQLGEGGTTTTFQYDRNGSTTSKTVGTNVTTYSYDGGRRLTEVKLNGANQASFTYGGNGARTSKTSAAGTTTYINDTRNLTQVLQETKSGTTRSYVPGLSQCDPAQSGQTQWAYFHADAQNHRVLSDGGAAVSKRWEYEPFGLVRSQSGSANSDFGYAGEQRDDETGLINLRARYYDPGLGWFISRDVVAGKEGFPQSFNRFSYVLSNPPRHVDPSGYSEDQTTDLETLEEAKRQLDPDRPSEVATGSQPARPAPDGQPVPPRTDNQTPGLEPEEELSPEEIQEFIDAAIASCQDAGGSDCDQMTLGAALNELMGDGTLYDVGEWGYDPINNAIHDVACHALRALGPH